MTKRAPSRILVALVGAVFVLSACGAPGASGSAVPTSPVASPTPAGSSPDGGSTGGGSGGDPGSGGGAPPIAPVPVDPGDGQAVLVVPRPGQRNLRPVVPISLRTSIDGRHVLVKVSWYSGVEPCSVLDHVAVDRTGTAVALTVFEGSGDPNAVCIEIAMLKATIVDLGELEPGTWTISAPGSDVVPLVITIG